MPRKRDAAHIEAWTLDQLAKSAFFHRKLHEWKLIEVAVEIEQIQGEDLDWDNLNISEQAWNKAIHRGIKPVILFAHPFVLQTVAGAVGYYRMLTMASQKSMKNVGVNVERYEAGMAVSDEKIALPLAQRFNRIISVLVEADSEIDVREFDLWRGMAAGSQAQGSWQNNKGVSAEVAIREIILRRLQDQGLISGGEASATQFDLGDNRKLIFSADPDIAVYQAGVPLVAVEVKGGIDPAAVLERLGASLKSLQRIRKENANSVTVLIAQDVSLTARAQKDLNLSHATVTHMFSANVVLEDETYRERLFRILGI